MNEQKVTLRISQRTYDKMNELKRKTSIPISCQGRTALLYFLLKCEKIDEQYKENFGKSIASFPSSILDKNCKWMIGEIIDAVWDAPEEDRGAILKDMEDSRNRIIKQNNMQRRGIAEDE